MSSETVTDLLHQLNMNGHADNKWDDASQIQDIMFVTPDRQFAWLFRIEPEGGVFPSSVNNNGYDKCNLYIHNVSACRTVSECLQAYNITIDNWSGFVVLNSNGELIDPAQARVQTIVIKSKI
jgi:hypothetical protein